MFQLEWTISSEQASKVFSKLLTYAAFGLSVSLCCCLNCLPDFVLSKRHLTDQSVGPASLQKVRDFVVYVLEEFARDSRKICLGTCPHRNEERSSGKIRESIRRLENRNRQRSCSANNLAQNSDQTRSTNLQARHMCPEHQSSFASGSPLSAKANQTTRGSRRRKISKFTSAPRKPACPTGVPFHNLNCF